jgi:hypothetical protein
MNAAARRPVFGANRANDMLGVALVGSALVVAGCSRSDAAASASPMAESASSGAGTKGATTPSGSTAAMPGAPAAPSSASSAATWTGTYTATAGTLYVPDAPEWKGVKFRGDEAPVGLGPGSLELTVDGAGHAQGTLDGPLGPLRVQGELSGDELTAALVPTDPTKGFSGTAVGHIAGTKIEGTMHLASESTANVIRTASFALTRGAAR